MAEPQEFPPNTWVTVWWGREHSDAQHHHRNDGGPSFVKGRARYTCTCSVRIEGLDPGTEIQTRVFERRDEDGKEVDGVTAEWFASQGATFISQTVVDSVNAGDRVRFKLIHYGTKTGLIKSGTAKALAWPL